MLTNDEIIRLKSLSDEELLAELGRALINKKQLGLRARPSLNKLIQQANEWLRSEQERLQSAVCNDPKIHQLARTEAGASEKLIRVVVDVISSLTIFVPVATVAEIIIRDGIPTYCKEIWKTSS